MLSLVNYDESESEHEITDDETEAPSNSEMQMLKNDDPEINELGISSSTIKLPLPSHKKHTNIQEDDDEFLKKKAVFSEPPKKAKIRITIPRLSEFQEDDVKPAIIQPVNKKGGLLGLLPKPSHSFAPASKHSSSNVKLMAKPSVSMVNSNLTKSSSESVPMEKPKSVGLIPYALMSHNPKSTETQSKTKGKEAESDDEDEQGAFFTFTTDEELPQVSEEEMKALVAKETARIEQRKRQHDKSNYLETESNAEHYQSLNQSEMTQHQQQQNLDEEAMKSLLGGNKAKRSKLDNIQIIDLSSSDVLPNREEWMRKQLAGETNYMPTGNIQEKGPNALAKRKHQISYLSMRAENNEQELEAMWASNRQTKRETKSKYGF